MSDTFLIVINLVGLAVFGFIGVYVCHLLSNLCWETGRYGGGDLPWWAEFGIFVFFLLLWVDIMIVLMLTIWKPDTTTYSISISWQLLPLDTKGAT